MKTYATWNPSDKDAAISLSGGNLVATGSGSAWKSVRATIGVSSGKRYWETPLDAGSGATWNIMTGVGTSGEALSNYVSFTAAGWCFYENNAAVPYKGNNGFTAYGSEIARGDVIGVALDMDGGKITFYKNGVSMGEAYSGLSGTVYPMLSLYDNQTTCTANFGATAFAYTPPVGYNSGLYTGSDNPTLTGISTITGLNTITF